MIKYYDLTINYHPGKANVVADALSRKSGVSLAALITQQPMLLKEFERMQIEVRLRESGGVPSQLNQVSI